MSHTYSTDFTKRVADQGNQKEINENRLMTISDLCEYLNCKPSYVYRLTYERKIPHIKLGRRTLRFDPRQINEWLADNRIEPSDTF